MKKLILFFTVMIVTTYCLAGNIFPEIRAAKFPFNTSQIDTVKLITDGNRVFYQQTIKVDSNIKEPIIYLRTVQFMAAKNITQTYGYQQEGKLIFSTFQDLNINRAFVGDDSENVQTYSVQFAIIVDIKNGRYRYTIQNIIFFLPTDYGNRRETMSDIYEKATNTDSRRIAREAKSLIYSFERYITSLTNELNEDIEQKSVLCKSNF